MNFLQTLWLKRSNRKLHRDIVSSVRHMLAEDDDILSDEEKARLAEFAKFKDPLFSSSLWRRLGEPNFGKGA